MATHDEEIHMGDIEKQLLNTHPRDQSSSPTTTTTTPPSAQNPTTNVKNDNDNKADIEASKSVDTNPTTTTTTIKKVVGCFILSIIALVLYPLVVVYFIGSVCIAGDIKFPEMCFSQKKEGDGQHSSSTHANQSIYKKMLGLESTKEKLRRLNLATTTRIGCLALLWLVVNFSVPSLKTLTLLHYPLCKWSLLVVVIFLGYPLTMMAAFVIGLAIYGYNVEVLKTPRNYIYYLTGLGDSLVSLLYFVAILVIWLCYFHTEHGLHPSERFDKFGTCTSVSLLVGAILWVLKSAMLLEWKANAVHKRLKGRILMAGFQFYFLTLIIEDGNYLYMRMLRDLLLRRSRDEKRDDPKTSSSTIILSDGGANDRKNLRFQDYMLSKRVPLFQMETVAKFVTDLAKVTQRENDGIPEIVTKCQDKIPTGQDDGDTVQYITEQGLKDNFGLNEDDAQLLLQELKGEQMTSDEITYDTFQRWMVDAHKNCLSVGYTLIDAFAVVSVLNRVIIGCIFVAVILIWLLITGLATTKVLLLIASPFLTFTFVFGDTCKTFFQGIIFSFVTHPYDVGDRCIIEGIELEVKRISILTTTFLRIGTKEKMMYPNAILATKLITNLEGEPDPSDMIELILDSSTTKLKILGLKRDLESFFESSDRHGSYEKTIHVSVNEIKSSIKVSISFTHVMNVHDVSHSQCVLKKNKQRSELLVDIKQFLEDNEIKLAPPFTFDK